MNRLLTKVFENRGYPDDFLEKINACDHAIPKDIDVLCAHLDVYRKSQDLLICMDDFDMDGICCGIISFAGLAELGFRSALYLPDTQAGYGFRPATVDAILAAYPDAKGILTGDVGISAYEGVAYARSLGLDVFVTDHHKLGSHKNPANVVVDPHRMDDTAYAFVCGATVMYQVLRYYAEHYMPQPGYYISQIDRLRVFAGFGTVSDAMPLYHENRQIVLDSLSICRMVYGDGSAHMVNSIEGCDVYRRVFLGLYELLCTFVENRKISDVRSLGEDFYGYYLAPAFNSIKRMCGDISIAYSIFFGGMDAAKESIQILLDLTEQRKSLVAHKLEELQSNPQPWAPYIYITDAIPGIRGLLAQEMLSATGLPSLVLALDGGHYSGSGRCPMWYPFLDIMQSDLWSFGGHNPAFGISTNDEDSLQALHDAIAECVEKLRPSPEEMKFKPDFVISTLGDGDCDLDLALFKDYLYELEYCRPFGSGFPIPVSLFRFATRESNWRIIGKTKEHVKITLRYGFSILCFFSAHYFENGKIDMSKLPDVVEVIGKLSVNYYNDVRTVQFIGRLNTDVTQAADVPLLDFSDVDVVDMI